MVDADEEDERAGLRGRDRLGRVVRHPLPWILTAWVAANVAWLAVYRRSRLLELDESGYATMAMRLGRQRTGEGFWGVLHEGYHGPLQALLSVPPQLVRGQDPAILLVENVLFGAGTAASTYLLARRLGGRAPALVAAVVVLLTPGIVDQSHLALTVMPSVFFATAAMAAVARSDGLDRRGWALAAGVAIGAMTLSRSMTLGFVPAFVVAAGGWALARRTPWRRAATGAATAAVGGLVVAAWWWIVRWSDVSGYLFGGGSVDTVQTHNPPAKLRIHADELTRYIGTATLTAALLAWAVLWGLARWRATRADVTAATDPERSPAPAPGPDPAPADAVPRSTGGARPGGPAGPPLWPLWAAAATVLGVLSLSGATGVGFALPALPWVVAALTVGVHRSLAPTPARIWSAVVVLVALATVVTTTDPGLRSDAFCTGEARAARPLCQITTSDEGAEWGRAVGDVADRLVAIQRPSTDAGEPAPDVAIDSRDFLVNVNTIGLVAELRYQTSIGWGAHLDPSLPVAVQVDEAVTTADVIVTTPDSAETVLLGVEQPPPDVLAAAAAEAGFVPCEEVGLPDGRTVAIVVRPDLAGRCA